MRTFTSGVGADRRYVILEVNGGRVVVTEGKTTGNPKRSEKDLKGDSEARAALERMALALLARGYAEQSSASINGNGGERPRSPKPAEASRPAAAPRIAPASRPKPAPAPAPRVEPARPAFIDDLFDDVAPASPPEAQAIRPPEDVAPVLRRGGTPAAKAASGERPKAKKKGNKKGASKSSDALDTRVIGGFFLGAGVLVALAGWFAYDSFLKPASIVGTWAGSKLEYEVSQYLTHSSYRLVLDAKKRAALTLQDSLVLTGTYAVKGNTLTLNLKDDEGAENDFDYKVSLGRATMDLFDPESGDKVVQLVRQDEKPSVGDAPPPPAPPVDIAAAPPVDAGDDGEGAPERAPAPPAPAPAADPSWTAVEFTPKDGAFRVRHPAGWKEETGSRPDNTYSWARFTKGSGKIQVFADVAGSLMSGADAAVGADFEEGSTSAPVHSAHELYAEKAAEEYSDYKESEPTLFKGSSLGEGRIAAFTASGGGLFGGKLRGYRVTHLTHNRRVSFLCSCPEGDFEKLKPTFLAVCRSLSN